MKMKQKALALLLTIGSAFAATAAYAGTLSVSLIQQEHSNWCWAASTQMVLNYKGKWMEQCAMANRSFGLNYACGEPTFDWDDPANEGNYNSEVAKLLIYKGLSAKVVGSMSLSSIKAKIDASKPIIFGWSWTGGGGHDVVLKGYSGSDLYFNDPWPGEGSYWMTYTTAHSSSDRYNDDAVVLN